VWRSGLIACLRVTREQSMAGAPGQMGPQGAPGAPGTPGLKGADGPDGPQVCGTIQARTHTRRWFGGVGVVLMAVSHCVCVCRATLVPTDQRARWVLLGLTARCVVLVRGPCLLFHDGSIHLISMCPSVPSPSACTISSPSAYILK